MNEWFIMNDLIEQLRADIVMLRNDIVLISHDVTQMREQLDRIEQNSTPAQESMGLVPGTPPPTFMPGM
jgi:hypothetical protein